MGCDIHLYVEKRGDDGVWQSAEGLWTHEDDDVALDTPWRDRFYHGRNYDLFAILANVRNGYGFAGVTTGRGFNVISGPRGLPEDCDARIKSVSDSWGQDGHSHSHHTLAELLAFDWTQVAQKIGVVDALTFYRWSLWGRGNWKIRP